MKLTIIDYLIMGVPMVLILGIAFVMRVYVKSVADFLAANRCAGRYLICTASGEITAAVMGIVTGLESWSKTGFSMVLWGTFLQSCFFSLPFLVWWFIAFETRCLTFHQFLEVRYSKLLRVFASFANIFSGLINFGLIPAVGGRFFVYLCGLPENLSLAGINVPTFAIVMVVLMAVSLLLTLTGGQISVMVTDCIEGLISSVLCLVVAFFVAFTISLSQIKSALLSGTPGNSYINPFDIGSRADFNGGYVLLSILLSAYIFRGNAWNQGFSAAAKTAHEGRMAGILGWWRGYAFGAMMTIVALGAFALLHNPTFATQQILVEQGLKNIHSEQLQTEMRMPLALGILLIPGVKGAFCAIGLFGLLSSQGMQLHSYAATLLQDSILPLIKKPLSPKAHLLALRLTATGVAICVCTISLFYKPVDYLVMMVTLIGAIYFGGMGAVVWGGLYWKKGTTEGGWAAMLIGTLMALAGNIVEQCWMQICPLIIKLAGNGRWATYLTAHQDKCPINGMEFTAAAAACALLAYAVVSLLTCKKDFDLDRMLHRGIYAIKAENEGIKLAQKRWDLARLISIDEHCSQGDKLLIVTTVIWVMGWQMVGLGALLWYLFVSRLSDGWWFNYFIITSVWVGLVLGVITTIWFTIGTSRDIIDLLKTLRIVRRNNKDDGTVRRHHNLGEPKPADT